MTDTALWLIRHAESAWNAVGRWQGQGDPPLSECGRAQARELADELAGEPIDAIYSSDLARAVETASVVAAGRDLKVVRIPDLRELDIGAWTGLTREQIDADHRDALARFDAGDPEACAGGAECRAELLERARRAVAAIVRRHPGERIAIVTHLGVIRALLPGSEPDNADCLRVRVSEMPGLTDGPSR